MCSRHLSALATSTVHKKKKKKKKKKKNDQSFKRDFTKKNMENAPAKQLNYVF